MEKIELKFEFDNTVAKIILNDGKGNVLDKKMMSELQHLLESFAKYDNLKLITFEGANGNFSFGASVEEHKKNEAAQMLSQFHLLFYTLRDLSIPTLAKISGQCLGGGLELALMCNVLFAEKNAKLGQPEISLGVFPPPASILLPIKLGSARAEELLIAGKIIDAQTALTMGLINSVSESTEELNRYTESWIQKFILNKSASSLRFANKAARIQFNHALSTYLPQLEELYVNHLMNTKDANEGIHSFLEKRKPVWENC